MKISIDRSGAGLAFAVLIASVAFAQSDSEISRLFVQIHAKENVVKPPKGILKHEYLVPAGPYFQLFDWDMYFMGVALSYDGVGKPVASSVEDFLEFVDEYANWPGYAPREIAPDALWALPEMCKPFLAQAAVRASRTMGDYQWLLRPNGDSKKTNYAKLGDVLLFWENTRRAPDEFFLWYNGVESGVDNNPAVSDTPAQVTEGVDLQCYLYREYRAMAVLAGKLGLRPDAEKYKAKADDLAARVRGKMWSEADSMFLNIDARNGRSVTVKTWTNFVPLWAGIATPAQAERMIKDHILNPSEFWCDYGLRTLAPSEPLYDPRSGYWRGPVWVISNYLVMHGLMNYGYKPEARQLAQKTVKLLVEDIEKTGGMNENYNPENGAPAAGGHFLSWNLLAEHMIDEAEKGTDPTALE
ncbi:MAG TPA: trehalase family glycosidase [Terriglobia bacterium]